MKFEQKFIAGIAVTYFISSLQLDFARDAKCMFLTVIDTMDEKMRRALYPPPTNERIKQYADAQMRMNPWEDLPESPWTPLAQQVLPTPIWTNVKNMDDETIRIVRVYGGSLATAA
jgi:hypothetical protein